ncbi:hypothetical protein AB0F81_40620 [Actinoplanes sp. NPDC024001]|uniref:hypothetical protein n=1 Tax=Actinoplanes sp. NPDC024001 TaxID=3154598 RepID=UPI0034003C2F
MTRSRFTLSRRLGALLVGLTALAAGTAQPAVAAPQPQAHSISVVRTGGIHGGLSSFALSGGGTRHATEVLRLASSPAFRALRPRYVPKNTCCDRYLYRVAVGYTSGRTKKVVALESTPGTPKVLWDVIHRMETMPNPVSFPPGFPFN